MIFILHIDTFTTKTKQIAQIYANKITIVKLFVIGRIQLYQLIVILHKLYLSLSNRCFAVYQTILPT